MAEQENWSGADLGSAPLFKEKLEKETPSYDLPGNFYTKKQFDLEQACIDFMLKHSFPVEKIVADNSWQRLSIDGGKDEDEWYIAHAGVSVRGNSWLMCSFGTFAGGFQQFGTFKSWDNDIDLSLEERKEHERGFTAWKEKNKEQTAKAERERIQKSQDIWKNSSEEPLDQMGHLGYLSLKKIGRYGIRFSHTSFNDGTKEFPQWNHYSTILIPLRNIDGEIQAVQHIRADGKKRIYGPKKGNFHIIGDVTHNSCIYIAEGYATAASVYEAKRIPTVVGFDCGNLDPVITTLRKKYSKNSIVILGDDDVETEGNPGRTKAEAVAKKYRCKVLFPVFPEDFRLPPNPSGERKRPTDWNDLHVYFGVEHIREQLLEEWYKKKPIPFKEVPFQFDLSVLPEEFTRAIKEECRFIKCPQEILISSGMTVLNAAIGKSAIIEELPGLEHYPRQGYVNVLQQGTRKSQAFKDMSKSLDEYERDKKVEWESRIKSIQAKNFAIEDEIRHLKKGRGKNNISSEEYTREVQKLILKKEKIPPKPRIWTSDVTEPRLFELMEERNGEFAVMSGEGRSIVNNILGKTNGSGETNESIYLSGISGDKITRDRIGTNGEKIDMTIDDPCLNFGVMIQPDKWAEMAESKKLRESGFIARLFVLFPASEIGYRTISPTEHRGLKEVEVEPFHDKIRLILKYKDENRDKRFTHKTILSPEAANARDSLFNKTEINLRPGRKFSEDVVSQGLGSKYVSQVCKLALSLHIFGTPHFLLQEQSYVTLETWNQAVVLGGYFLHETLRALHSVKSSKHEVSVEEKLVFWLYDRFIEGKVTKSRDIQQRFRPKMNAEEASSVLKKTEQHYCARISYADEIELHPFILENGLDWLKRSFVLAEEREDDAGE